MSSYSTRTLEIFLLVLSFVIFVAGIWSPSILTQGDESDYIRTSQEMFESGDYLSPSFRGEPRFTKPPLLYWMVLTSYQFFGESFFASRLPVVLCAVITILFVFRMGLLLFDRESAWISALIAASCFGMVKFSKIVLMESPLVLTYLLSFYYFARFYKEEKGQCLVISFAFLGFSALLKSPVYSLIGGVSMGLFLLAEGRLNRLLGPHLLPAVLIALGLSIPWYIAMIALHGSLFTDFYLNEHTSKFGDIPHFILRVWFGLLLYLLPWTVYVLYSIFVIWRERLYREWNHKLLLIVIGVFLIVFMIPDQKGLYYSIPLLPYCALMTGGVLGGRFPPGIISDRLSAVLLCIAALVFASSIVLLGSALGSALLAFVFSLSAALLLFNGRRTAAMILAGLALVPLYTHIFPSINFEIVPVRDTLEITGRQPIYSFRISPLKFSNALGREVHELLEEEELKEALAGGGFSIINADDYRALDANMRGQTRVLLEWMRWRRRIPFDTFFSAILTGNPEKLHQRVLLIAR